MRFIKVDHTPDGEPMNTEDEICNSYMWQRYVRLDQFVEFRIEDDRCTGDDLQLFVTAYLPEDKEDPMYGAIIAVFERNELDKAKAYLKGLFKELNV